MTFWPRRGSGRLARLLAVYIILFSSVLALVITAAELSIEYFRDLQHIDDRMSQVEVAYLPSITENVWVADNERLSTLLTGITRLPDFVMAEVRVDGKSQMRRGEALQGDGTTQMFELRHAHRGQSLLIGELIVSASYQALYARTINRLVFILVANGLKTLLVVLFLFVIFYRMIGRHIEHIARYADLSVDPRDTVRLALARKESQANDELSELVDAINSMRQRLLEFNHFQVRRADELEEQVAERKRTEAELRIAAAAFETQEGMMITDANNVIQRINRAFTSITGYTAAEVVGQTPSLLSSGRHDAAFYAEMWESIQRTGAWQGEIWDRRKNGEEYPKWLTISVVKGEDGLVTHYVGMQTDITLRKAAADEIEHLAFYDHLTNLPNRRLLLDRLKQAVATRLRSGNEGALMFIDLDNFKTLNDTLGHHIGDLLLQQVAQRLTACIREGDTVARLGGDEFVVMLEDLSDNSQEAATLAEAVAAKILAALNLPYQLDGHEHHSTPSIGITLLGDNKESIEECLKRADLAMYQAKAAGRNTIRFFDPKMQAVVTARIALATDLDDALWKNQLHLHYQAQVDTAGRVTGAEALVRWQHPQRGMVSPADFIPLAEETGLILPLGHWVVETACYQLAAWSARQETAHLSLAVNISAGQFHHSHFVDLVLAVLDHTGADPRKLKLELTESLLVANIEEIIAKMSVLKGRGVIFSLDDFGTGYSSLSYLKRLPLDQLKIDQSFVRDVLDDPSDAAIAKTIVALAHSLELEVIAEGVETADQRDFLAANGCHAYQGYLFSRPLPLEEFERFLSRA